VESYESVYLRNIGLFTGEEQNKLRNAAVAVAGVGGVGSYQAVALARQGIGELRIMDPGIFDVPDMNRQYGAMKSTIGRNKAEVTSEILRDINPFAVIKTYVSAARNAEEIDEFIGGCSLVIDAIDYAGFHHKQLLHARARERGLYVMSSPIPGFGASLMIFEPSGMKMEEFYNAPSKADEWEKFKIDLKKLIPEELLPRAYHDFSEGKIGYLSTNGASAQLSGAILGFEAAMIIAGRRGPGELTVVPEVMYADLFNHEFRVFRP
jgi:molybdopterin/thiamine biosynthesis adenylyltransferase